MKILAVDDDASILELLPLVAGRLGFQDVTTVASGDQALAVIGQGARFDCFLLDINMPGMNGIELCSRIRSLPGHLRTPIVMLTAMSERDYIERAFQSGATDYATKPFDFIELGARLRAAEQLLQARRQADEVMPPRRAAPPGRLAAQAQPDAARIRQAGRMIEPEALHNYLAQLSRAGLAASQVLALRLCDLDALHPQVTLEEATFLLSEVANAIDAALLGQSYMMAHKGRGVFVIVSNRATLLDAVEFESDVQSVLDDSDLSFDDGRPADLEVFAGSPARLDIGTPDGIAMVIERAMARAERRQAFLASRPRPPNIRRTFAP